MESKQILEQDCDQDVVGVGAGPIGLFTAIQIKLYKPKCKIVLYEKYQEYQRKHAISINKKSFQNSHPDEKFQELIKQISGTIRTNVLEQELKKFALGLGIEIKYQEVVDVKALVSNHPECRYLIGADGSHSTIHKQIFHGKYQLKYNFRNIMEIKYEVLGSARKLNLCTSLTCGSRHLVHQFIGKNYFDQEIKTTPVVLRFLVTEDEYQEMKEASFKNPWTLEDKRIPDKVKKSIDSWLLARKEQLEEEIVPNSARLDVVSLPTYASSTFYKKNKDVTTFLVGDAACGVPYFRSINNGLLCASFLAKNLDEPEIYNDFVQSRVKRELLGAKIKDKVITSMDYSHSSIVSSIDASSNLFSKKQKEDHDDDLEESTTYSLVSICSIL